jgi:hypothetical protein
MDPSGSTRAGVVGLPRVGESDGAVEPRERFAISFGSRLEENPTGCRVVTAPPRERKEFL